MSKTQEDKQELKIKIVAGVVLLVIVAGVQMAAPEFFPKLWSIAAGGDMEATAAYLSSFGGWAIVVSFLLDVLINALGFLPSIFLSTANGLIFGLPLGILISWTAESVGVIISFFIMRYLFRNMAEKIITSSKSLSKLDEMSSDKGLVAMAIARTLPYFPSGILTAVGAISKMSARDYIIATFIGKFPSTALEVIVGHDIVNYNENMNRLAIIVVIIAIIYGWMYWRKK